MVVFSLLGADYFLPGFPIGLCEKEISYTAFDKSIPQLTSILLSRLLELVRSQGAILVCPDYRLLPEATGLDILSDIDSFWSWLPANLEAELTSHINPILRPAFDRILVTGDSAGGFCAIQSILRHPELSVKAVIMPYPIVHLRSRHWTEKTYKPILGLPDASPPFLPTCNSAGKKTMFLELMSKLDHPDTIHHSREPLKDSNN